MQSTPILDSIGVDCIFVPYIKFHYFIDDASLKCRTTFPCPNRTTTLTANQYIREFCSITGYEPVFDDEYRKSFDNLVNFLTSKRLRPFETRKKDFIAIVNSKLGLNSEGVKAVLSLSASLGHTYHFHEKNGIQRSFDHKNRALFESILKESGVSETDQKTILNLYRPVDEKFTIEQIHLECENPSQLRKDIADRNIKAEIIKALFSAFMWCSLDEKDMHSYFDSNFDDKNYSSSYWNELKQRSPHLFGRDNALYILALNQNSFLQRSTYADIRNPICHAIETFFQKIDNHGFLAILLEPISLSGKHIEWQLVADIMLFGEKHVQEPLKKAYFRSKEIESETLSHIPNITSDQARFDLANDGFTYRDCFIISDKENYTEKILLLFQKNKRDETPIACPKCRSLNVEGNSYPSLGVKSWECRNPLCPERSKYNRGKRFSFKSLLMQQAIEDPNNEINSAIVKEWLRDVIFDTSDNDIADMLIRFYSMYGDAVHIFGWPSFDTNAEGRKLVHHKFESVACEMSFFEGPFFQRYVTSTDRKKIVSQNLGDKYFQVYSGDSSEVLKSFREGTFDGAVTSPPYYNAREYSQWPNIYCYLHDMLAVSREVFRTLKNGALYYYNIFDYFDNERTVTFSAMGNKRMILSAYTVDLFRRVGFELIDNIVWFKGNIEGKRGFNAGNFSPYYQSPFNCWEHVLVFRKPDSTYENNNFLNHHNGQVLSLRPVIKMVGGKNVHGHTAPFPDGIPQLLISKLPKGATILDPFAGSLTTGRVAEKRGLRSVCIEKSIEYCKLGLSMRTELDSCLST